jgi:very-short-patch-repair endonuclease/predicted transcriptional regulator of viral defense system
VADLRDVNAHIGSQRREDAEIARLAEGQHGVVSRGQLVALGLTPRKVQRRLAAGRLHPLHRGVYCVGHRVLSREGRWLAAVLAGGPGAVLSHMPAAALWGIVATPAGRVDVTVGAERRQRQGIRFHRAAIGADEVTTERGVPVTTPARTLLDLAKTLDQHRLHRAIDRAEQHRLTGHHPLDELLTRYPKAPGAAKLRAITEQGSIGDTVTRSELEDRFLQFLDAHGLPRPEMNQRIKEIEGDCVWREHRLMVELDGRATHQTTAAFERDRERDRLLQSHGWRVIRLTWRQLHKDTARVKSDLSRLLLDDCR